MKNLKTSYLLAILIACVMVLNACSKDKPDVVNIKSIQIKSQPTKTVYTLGESLSLEGLMVELTYQNGEKKEITTVSPNQVRGFEDHQ